MVVAKVGLSDHRDAMRITQDESARDSDDRIEVCRNLQRCMWIAAGLGGQCQHFVKVLYYRFASCRKHCCSKHLILICRQEFFGLSLECTDLLKSPRIS